MSDPTTTQKVLAKAKVDSTVVKKTWLNAHRGSLLMYYAYFISFCLSLKQLFPDIEEYFPVTYRRYVIGFVTFVVFADKLRRSRPAPDELYKNE